MSLKVAISHCSSQKFRLYFCILIKCYNSDVFILRRVQGENVAVCSGGLFFAFFLLNFRKLRGGICVKHTGPLNSWVRRYSHHFLWNRLHVWLQPLHKKLNKSPFSQNAWSPAPASWVSPAGWIEAPPDTDTDTLLLRCVRKVGLREMLNISILNLVFVFLKALSLSGSRGGHSIIDYYWCQNHKLTIQGCHHEGLAWWAEVKKNGVCRSLSSGTEGVYSGGGA